MLCEFHQRVEDINIVVSGWAICISGQRGGLLLQKALGAFILCSYLSLAGFPFALGGVCIINMVIDTLQICNLSQLLSPFKLLTQYDIPLWTEKPRKVEPSREVFA
jgi:hypothetical protein